MLTQQTKYPTSNTTQFQLDLERTEDFTIYVRVPAWADGKTRISVNGKRMEGELVAGKFFALTRAWKNGDQVEFEIGMPLSLQAVDAENPQIVALRCLLSFLARNSSPLRRLLSLRRTGWCKAIPGK
jgi:DUF1680 family protein